MPGKTQTRVITVPLPAHLAGKTVQLEITPGYTEKKEKADAENLSSSDPQSARIATYPSRASSSPTRPAMVRVAYKGHVVKNLPAGALDTIRPTTASVAPESFKNETRIVVPLGDFMVGTDRVDVDVKPVLR